MFRTERQHFAWLPLIEQTRIKTARLFLLLCGTLALLPGSRVLGQNLGQLEGHADFGKVLHAGSTVYDAANDSYTVTGSGSNLWFTADEMQFAWKRMRGDVAVTAQIDFVGDKGNNHRKAALMVRQSLDPSSPYVDVARHGDGLTSLQFRLGQAEVTREVETAVSAPHWVRLERRGDFVFVYVGDSRETLKFSGASMHLPLQGDFYVGLAVCSHDKDVSETAVFSHLQIEAIPAASGSGHLWSTLETVKVASTDRRVMYSAPERIVASNWSHDGASVLFAQAGTLQRFELDPAPYPSLSFQAMLARHPSALQADLSLPVTGEAVSPNGSQVAVSAGSPAQMSVLPFAGGAARKLSTAVSATGPTWSPDGRTLAFTGKHGSETDVFTTSVQGGTAVRLSQHPGPNQDPDFSPDGQWLYFSSGATGHSQLWRMHPDGKAQEQVLSDSDEDLDPHPSPDGKWLVYLAMPANAAAHAGDRIAELRLLSLTDRKPHLLATALAGSGTLSAPCWSPDSTRVTFISYANVY